MSKYIMCKIVDIEDGENIDTSSLLKLKGNEKLKTDISISQEMVDNFIKDINIEKIGSKTTLVNVTLVNGFEITKTSSCVDPMNFSMKIGAEICLNEIKNEIWKFLGFLLNSATGNLNK